MEKRRQEASGANGGGNKYGSAKTLKSSKTETFLEYIEDEESLTGEKKKHNVSFADSQRTLFDFVRLVWMFFWEHDIASCVCV